MREARRQNVLDLIDKLEKALRNIGFLKEELQMEGCHWYIDEFQRHFTEVPVVDFLHELYHAVKRLEKQENIEVKDKTDANFKECELCNKMVSSSVVYNGVRVCESCVRSRKLWLMIPDEDLREAGWIL